MPKSLTERVIALLINRRRWLLGAAIVLAAISALPASRLHFDRAIENMFSPNDPILISYQKLKRTFGGNEVVMAAYVDPQLMTPEGIERLSEVSRKLGEVPGVAATLSLDTLMGPEIISSTNPLAEKFRTMFQDYTHGADGETAAVVCMLTPEAEAPVPRAETIAKMRHIIEQMPSGAVAGEPVMVVDGFRYLEEDGDRLGYSSTLLLIATIAICFRSLRWVLIPILVVQLTLLLTRAILVGLDFRLSMVSTMLTAIITVVGVATVIHIIVNYRDARATRTPREALLFAGTILAGPVVWACLTDAVGFASLLVTNVGPVQDFGVMMATGALLVIVSVVLLVPGLALVGSRDLDPKRAWGEASLDWSLRTSLRFVEKYPKLLATGGVVLAAVLAAGSVRLEVETDFTRNFRQDSPIVEAYELVEARLGGAGVWDIIVPAPPPEDLDWSYLSRVLDLEQRLRDEVPGLTKVLSVADGVKAGSVVNLDNVWPARLQHSMMHAGLTTMQGRMPKFYQALVGEDPAEPGKHYFRIMLRSPERQDSAAKQRLIQQVQTISREVFPKAEVTGYFVLLTQLIDSLIADQWIAFGLAAAGIGLMMLVAFRDLKLALIALVPNVVPIVMVTGLMGWLGLKINMGAAMIAAVSMGLSVDSSIHYIARFLYYRRSGLSPEQAREMVQQNVGRALFFSTLALIVGFGTLCTSEFVPTIYFGALVSLMMLGGMAGNLIVLPLLVKWLTRGQA